jgi:hypothetical protein
MTMENMEKRTEQSEAVCGRGLMFCFACGSLALVTLYITVFPLGLLALLGMCSCGWQVIRSQRKSAGMLEVQQVLKHFFKENASDSLYAERK